MNPLNKTFIRPKSMAPIYRIPLFTVFGCNLVWRNTDIVMKATIEICQTVYAISTLTCGAPCTPNVIPLYGLFFSPCYSYSIYSCTTCVIAIFTPIVFSYTCSSFWLFVLLSGTGKSWEGARVRFLQQKHPECWSFGSGVWAWSWMAWMDRRLISSWIKMILVWTPCLMHRCVISTMFGSCFSFFF